eukprot:COSAG01_NODE_5365_length_4308_cov_1.852697_3_plen_180_part_00
MVRALYANFSGPLYQVKRSLDNATKDIGVTPSGFADAQAQDIFCDGSTVCRVHRIYDQSQSGVSILDVVQHSVHSNCSWVGTHNNSACPGCGGPVPSCDVGVNASRHRIELPSVAEPVLTPVAAFGASTSARHVYAAYFEGGMGYHFNGSNSSGVAEGDEPESIMMVTSGVHFNDQCCL